MNVLYILRQIFLITVLAWSVLTGEPVKAQDTAQSSELTFLTVERPPFSSGLDGNLTGFSIELMRAIAEDMGTEVTFKMVDSFGEMLDRQFRPEDYGIALPAESALREPINVALLQLMEKGEYEEIARRWFGQR